MHRLPGLWEAADPLRTGLSRQGHEDRLAEESKGPRLQERVPKGESVKSLSLQLASLLLDWISRRAVKVTLVFSGK